MIKSLDDLKEKILQAQKDSDIASLYVLEASANELLDDTMLSGYYSNILDLALEKLTNALEEPRKMSMKEVQDFATIRALYEYGMEHYSADGISDASALFEVLSGLTDDHKFSKALKLHQIASAQNMSLNDFMNNIADMDETQRAGAFYISAFTKEAQNLLDTIKTKRA